MPHRRHRPSLDQANTAMTLGPARETLPAEFRTPAEAARHRREALLEQPPRTRLGTEMVDQDDLAAGPHDAREFVEGELRIGHRGNDVLGDHRVEVAVGEPEMLRVHDGQGVDMREAVARHALVPLARPRLGIVAADDAVYGRLVRKL